MPKNSCLFQVKWLDDPRYSQWLKKLSDEWYYAATAKTRLTLVTWVKLLLRLT